jgi:predicted phosphodiesterase
METLDINSLQVLTLENPVPIEMVRIRAGPYLQNPAPDGMSIVWMTTTPCCGCVEYGTAESLGSIAFTDLDGMIEAGNVIHRVRIENLQPNTKYFYRIRCRQMTTFRPYRIVYGEDLASPVYSFTTRPTASDRVRFIIYNDLHDNVPLWRKLHDLVKHEPVDFVFLNGDITSHLLDENHLVENFLKPATELFGNRTPFLYARGNHETRGAWARLMKQYLAMPEDRYYYALNWGPARFVVLDCGEDKSDSSPVYGGLVNFDHYRTVQQKWLEKEVASDAFIHARWRILIQHIPAYYNNKPDTEETMHGAVDLRTKWAPIFNRSRIDLSFSGHTHRHGIYGANVEVGNHYPIVIGGAPVEGRGTVIFVDADRTHIEMKMLRDDGSELGELTVR